MTSLIRTPAVVWFRSRRAILRLAESVSRCSLRGRSGARQACCAAPRGLELARCEYITRRENIIALGNSGTGKTHLALGLGLAACQKGLSVGFSTAASLVHELIEARDEKRLLRLQRQLAGYKL